MHCSSGSKFALEAALVHTEENVGNKATGIKQPVQDLQSGTGNAVFVDDALMGFADPCCI